MVANEGSITVALDVTISEELNLQEDDTIDVLGLTTFAPGTPLTLVFHHADGSHDEIIANHTYNQQQIEWFKAGSALNLIKKQNSAA